MGNKRMTILAVAVLMILLLLTTVTWRRKNRRPTNIPSTAVLVEGYYLDCEPYNPVGGVPCKVYDRITGKMLAMDPFTIRLHAFATGHGGSLIDCGRIPYRTRDSSAQECVKTAFQNHRPFAVQYFSDFKLFIGAYGMAGDAKGNVAMASYESRGFPPVIPLRRTELLDGNRVRLTPCVAPVTLGITEDDKPGCIPPVNEKASATAAVQKPVETTICEIMANPTAFNNKLVRIQGHVSGNFEYSLLSSDGCNSMWFAYGEDETHKSPPELVAHVPGAATPGGEDEQGRRILPVPVSLVEDRNFKRFEKLMEARAKADRRSSRQRKNVSYRVTATFIGRVDSVSAMVHQFHLKRAEGQRADYLGFGQMGMFDAQFVMSVVEGDAVLTEERY